MTGRSLVAIAFLSLVILLVYGPVREFGFLEWDDSLTIVGNPALNPPSVAKIVRFWDWRTPYMDLFVPLTYTVWAGVASLGSSGSAGSNHPRLNPARFHTANLVVHLFSAILVFLILKFLLDSLGAEGASAVGAAGCGAALFALHPVQVEAVAWVSGLKDVLSGALALASAWLYLRFVSLPGPGVRRGVTFTAATACFVLAMLAKPSAVVLPLLVGVLDRMVLRRTWREVASPLGFWVALAAPIALVARLAQPAAHGFDSPFWARPLVALDTIAFYLGKLIFPVQLAIDYGRSPDWLARSPQIWVTWLVPGAILALVWRHRRSERRVAWMAPLALFALALLPELGFLRFDFQKHSTVADHYLYVAMLGPALALALALVRPRVRHALLVAAFVLIPLALLSRRQVSFWRDTSALMTHTLEVNPASLAAHLNLGHIRFKEGRFAEAAAHCEQALRTRPDDVKARNNLGNAMMAMNRPAEALGHYRIVLAAEPRNAETHFNLGNALSALERRDEAGQEYEAAVRIKPELVEAHTNLADVMLRRGEFDRALTHYQRALALKPDFPPARRGFAAALGARAKARESAK